MSIRLPYAVVAADLDGSLLTLESRISARAKATLQRLSAKGVHVVLATGRHYPEVAIILEKLELPRPGFFIACNGARALMGGNTFPSSRASGHGDVGFLLESDIDPDVVCSILQLLPDDEEEVNTNLFQADEWKSSLDWLDQLRYHQESGFRYSVVKPRTLVEQYRLYLQQRGGGPSNTSFQNPLVKVAKIAFISDNSERLYELWKRIRVDFKGKVEVALSSYCLDVCNAGVTKGNAIKQLLPRLAHDGAPVSLAECIAFGDGMNDKEMLETVGKGCIMSNASQQLKEALPHLEVIGSNATDGIANKLSSVFELD
ncbi:hydrolase [Trypanosoma grayi]|uniref:hydrolase n=1 Tax=Trypanosoma grayi TaxID=71804 RepID=UPI0004F46580|nr:hydrolase [Trypanosoma grayi]KEG08523.1 hydrolase [Trypanosoma grayi]